MLSSQRWCCMYETSINSKPSGKKCTQILLTHSFFSAIFLSIQSESMPGDGDPHWTVCKIRQVLSYPLKGDAVCPVYESRIHSKPSVMKCTQILLIYSIFFSSFYWVHSNKGTETAPLGHHFGKRLPFAKRELFFYGQSNGTPREPCWCHLLFWVYPQWINARWWVPQVPFVRIFFPCDWVYM